MNAQREECALGTYRVLDLTDEKGFFCGRILGDLGADVIKVESPVGDCARRTGPFYHDVPASEKSLYWFAYNANKRGVTLNIEATDGREILKKLAKNADFVIESSSPGYMESLGLGYEALSQIKPGIIVTSITAFGQKGPKANYGTTDLTSWASGGAMYCMGDPERSPVRVTIPQSYLHAGSEAAVACLIANHYRALSGEGQHIDVSIQESVVSTLMQAQELWDFNKYDCGRTAGAWRFNKPDGTVIMQHWLLPCKDGYVAFYTLGGTLQASVAHLQAFVKWMDEEGKAPEWLKNFDWVHDYQTAALTQEKVNKVEGSLIELLMTKTKAQLYDEAAKRRLLIAPANNAKDIWESDQLKARNFWEKVEHSELGETLDYCGPFAKLSQTPLKIRCRAPLIGEHNQEIYGGELGFSNEELARLKEAGAI